MAEVIGIDTAQRQVILNEQTAPARQRVPYDYLVLATGARENYFGHDEWRPFAPGLKTITEATALRRKILYAFEAAELTADAAEQCALLTFVIVGGGPTGVEMAGAIAELTHKALSGDFRHIDPASAHIILVEAMPRILGPFPAGLARKAQQSLQRLGVTITTGKAVERIDATGVTIGGEHIAARTVIWAAGVSASPAGKWLGCVTDRAGRAIVQADLTVPGHPEIFVIGDTAAVSAGKGILPGVAPVAMQAGAYVAQAISDRRNGSPNPRAFTYHNKGNLAVIGRGNAIADFGFARVSGFVGWFVWATVHILYLIGFRNRMLVMLQWAWSYLTFGRGARLITFGEEIAEAQLAHSQPREPVEIG